MKNLQIILISFLLVLLVSCKKDSVDASSTKNFQESINDMTSSLPTIKQIKFNEALYILKKFAVEGNDDITELKELAKLLDHKKVPEIFNLADQTAQKNGIEWSSTAPPSLGEMNIFGNEKAAETDSNDVPAKSLNIIARPVGNDSILGPKALQIIPRLVDGSGNPINFTGAALETIMEVSSNGTRLITSKNLMQDNNFKGFTIRFASLPKDKIVDDKIDVKISVKTTKKLLQLVKAGVPINSKALFVPKENPTESDAVSTQNTDTKVVTDNANNANTSAPTSDPKIAVSHFLNNLGSQNLRGAYDVSENPNWGSFDKFSNPTSGFGAVKTLSVKNISTASSNCTSANVNANYEVTDKDGKTTSLKVTFGLKNVNGEWKISSYKIN